jgi:hypothetical protein
LSEICDIVCRAWIGIGADIAVILAFIFTGITFWVTFSRRRKDEQIKTAMEVSKQLYESEKNFEEFERKLEDWKSDKLRLAELEIQVIKHFNNWEWFALLVNHKQIRDDFIKEHFKENFLTEYEKVLSRFPNLYDDNTQFPEVKILFKKWNKIK